MVQKVVPWSEFDFGQVACVLYTNLLILLLACKIVDLQSVLVSIALCVSQHPESGGLFDKGAQTKYVKVSVQYINVMYSMFGKISLVFVNS